ncbi:MAG: cold shock domain-containing protein [Sulfurimonadaceae bacterium]|nr:cold shock domain-containing protein [Sulfurimonadaceae bacterium]
MSGKEGKVFNGIVKFYNVAKGYGFLYADDLVDDVYFHINDWKNKSIPEAGDVVGFDVLKQSNGKTKAASILFLEAAPNKKPKDDRVTCPGCDRKIVPRLVIVRGAPSYSMCPYCGCKIRKFIDDDGDAPFRLLIIIVLSVVFFYFFLGSLAIKFFDT